MLTWVTYPGSGKPAAAPPQVVKGPWQIDCCVIVPGVHPAPSAVTRSRAWKPPDAEPIPSA